MPSVALGRAAGARWLCQGFRNTRRRKPQQDARLIANAERHQFASPLCFMISEIFANRDVPSSLPVKGKITAGSS
jgi:hypothetical protein